MIEADRDAREHLSNQQAMFITEVWWRQDEVLRIYLKNIGNGPAYKAQFLANGMRLNAFPTFQTTSLKTFEPTLEPQSTTTFEFELKSYLPRVENIAVVWIDGLGKQQSQKIEMLG